MCAYPLDVLALGRLCVADHVLRRAQFGEGQVRALGDAGSQGSLTCSRGAWEGRQICSDFLEGKEIKIRKKKNVTVIKCLHYCYALT